MNSHLKLRKPKNLKRWPYTRAEAIRRGLRRYDTGERCPRGHLSERHTSTGGCVACLKEDRQGKYKDQRAAYLKDYHQRRRAEYVKNRDARERAEQKDA